MLKVKGLSKRFGENQVLNGIDFSIKEGEVISILGSSGTGKSTFLRCLNYLEKPDSGTIEIDNLSINFKNITKKEINLLRSKTSMVFQNYNLFKNKTAFENILEPLITVKKMKKNEAHKIATESIELVGLYKKKNNYPETLSGGEKQRIGIARALSVNAKIMLLDEPTSSLDPELVNEVLGVIKMLASKKVTMIIVTHEMNVAKNISDQIVFMDKGIVLKKSTSKEFFSNSKNQRVIKFLQSNY